MHRRRRLRRFHTNVSIANTGAVTGTPFFANGSVSSTRVGWTVGGGIDYAVTNNWSVVCRVPLYGIGQHQRNNFGS